MEITQHKVIKINIRKKSYKTKKHNFKIITYVFLTEDGQTTTFNMHVGKKYPTITTNKIEYITSLVLMFHFTCQLCIEHDWVHATM